MTSWIPLGKGNYLAADAFLVGEDGRAASLENAIVEIYEDPRGNRRMRGSGFVFNSLVIALLEESETLDIVVDLGESFIFRLEDPDLNAGKVFAPNVKSVCHFSPRDAGRLMNAADFRRLVDTLEFIDPDMEG